MSVDCWEEEWEVSGGRRGRGQAVGGLAVVARRDDDGSRIGYSSSSSSSSDGSSGSGQGHRWDGWSWSVLASSLLPCRVR